MLLAVIAAARQGRPLLSGAAPALVRWLGVGVVLGGALLSDPGTWGQVVFHDFAAVGWFLLMASTVLGAPGQLWSRMLSWRGDHLARA